MSAPARPSLPAALALGPVHLTVTSLERSVAWYEATLGLRVHRRGTGEAELGDGQRTVVVLVEDRTAVPAGRHAGLYHYALLFPTREELARAARRLARQGTALQGASDHGTHEAIYLSDPDGIGIELAVDRPRDRWPTPEQEFGGGVAPAPLDMASLLACVEGEAEAERVRSGLRVGHVHLHVGDVQEGLRFYRDLIGFDEWFVLPSVAFVSAGDYHHHVAFNVWQGRDVPPAPPHAVGLRHWTVELPAAADVAAVRDRLEAAGADLVTAPPGFAVRDPWGIALRVEAPGTAA